MGTLRLITPESADARGPLPPHATPPRRTGGVRLLERLLLIAGIVLLGYYSYVSAETFLYQRFENRELDAILASAPAAAPDASRTAVRRAAPGRGALVGRVEIPRLGVSAIVKAGADARTLQLAVGHVPGTALPGEQGNVALAGHRDTFFRRLQNIRPDDEIRIVTTDGVFEYRVERTLIVEPEDVWVLDQTSSSTLTLVTCYPFSYVGTAPQRFIVRAVLTLPLS